MGLKCLLTHVSSLRDKANYRAANGSAGAGVGRVVSVAKGETCCPGDGPRSPAAQFLLLMP